MPTKEKIKKYREDDSDVLSIAEEDYLFKIGI
jgi:hypothetical protein